MSQETESNTTNNQTPPLTKEEIKADLRTNPRYKQFFERYSEWSLDDFITRYGWFKPFVLDCGKEDIKAEEESLERQAEHAYELLWQIQQRKLFNLQCEWRAGLITLPDVRTTWDFHYWGLMIQRCPFLSPISYGEYDLFQQYIMSNNYEDEHYYYIDWQEYDQLKECNDESDSGPEYPEWYAYYELYREGANWRMMSNVRGEKEDTYLRLYREERDKGKPPIHYTPMDPRPQLSPYDHKTMEEFVRLFETPEMLRCLQAYWRHKEMTDDEELEHAILTLKCASSPIPMEPHDNWRDAILAAARYARQVNDSQACKWAYTDYLRRQELGLPYEITLDKESLENEEKWRNDKADKVRRGRVLNGEPDDWNF